MTEQFLIRLMAVLALGSCLLGTPALADPSAGSLLAQTESLFENMEYDTVISASEKVLEHPRATAQQKLKAYVLQGSALVIVGNSVDAEIPFRSVLRIAPEHELPPYVSPKIVAVFNTVKSEEEAIRDQMRALELAQLLQEMAITGHINREHHGGVPLQFSYRVRDPRGLVEHFQVSYRRKGDKSYSALALAQNDTGTWSGQVSSEWTENENGFVMEYQLVTSDASGEKLISKGTKTLPLRIEMKPGTIAGAEPLHEKVWFWVVTGIAASTIAATAGYFIYDNMQPQDGAAVVWVE